VAHCPSRQSAAPRPRKRSQHSELESKYCAREEEIAGTEAAEIRAARRDRGGELARVEGRGGRTGVGGRGPREWEEKRRRGSGRWGEGAEDGGRKPSQETAGERAGASPR
jgi:hypothetical protein